MRNHSKDNKQIKRVENKPGVTKKAGSNKCAKKSFRNDLVESFSSESIVVVPGKKNVGVIVHLTISFVILNEVKNSGKSDK